MVIDRQEWNSQFGRISSSPSNHWLVEGESYIHNIIHNWLAMKYFFLQKMFFKFDRNRSGTLEKVEVRDALSSLGKYSPDTTVCGCCIHYGTTD